MELHFEPLAGIRLDPLAVDALVLVTGPGILELVQLEALVLQTRDIGEDALSVAGLLVLKGISDRIRHMRDGLLRGEALLLDQFVDLLFDALAAFHAVLEADQVPVRILAFRGANCWRDLFSLPFGDPVAL